MKKQELDAQKMQTFVSSLKDRDTALLILDTVRCKHSLRLWDEIEITKSLGDPQGKEGKRKVVHVLDLCHEDTKALDLLTWIPGVPCLLAGSQVHLGVDAFTKCREMWRSGPGISVQTLSLATN